MCLETTLFRGIPLTVAVTTCSDALSTLIDARVVRATNAPALNASAIAGSVMCEIADERLPSPPPIAGNQPS